MNEDFFPQSMGLHPLYELDENILLQDNISFQNILSLKQSLNQNQCKQSVGLFFILILIFYFNWLVITLRRDKRVGYIQFYNGPIEQTLELKKMATHLNKVFEYMYYASGVYKCYVKFAFLKNAGETTKFALVFAFKFKIPKTN